MNHARRRLLLLLSTTALAARAAQAASPAASAPGAPDGGAVALLRQWLRTTRSGSADFTQQVVDAKGARGTTARGHFAFARPGRFRWVYTSPYHQDIASDGASIWTYDHDLDQVTVTRASRALAGTPAALLAGADIDAVFRLQALPDADGLHWVLATPRSSDSAFAWVRIGLRDGSGGAVLAQMQLRDAFGRTSVIQFDDARRNPPLPESTFSFVAPAGAAVLDQR